jgi:prepilin-type N-terminal cleavage/methylation domain-containing protein
MRKTKAFTLVELIVVITILSILSIVWFVSFSWYLAWTRDVNRISQIKAISKWLYLYSTNKTLPTPDAETTSIMDWTTQIATQWYAWKTVLETIAYSTEWVDPKDKIHFSYYLTADKKYFQLMALLENETKKIVLLPQTQATDYTSRTPYVTWEKLWILTTSTNEPIQMSTWSIDISNVWDLELKSFLKTDENLYWSWTTFASLWTIAKVWWRWYSVTEAWILEYKDLDAETTSTTVTEETPTIPTEWLIAYYPLTDDANDAHWSNNWTSQW